MFSVSSGYLLVGAVQQRQADSVLDFGVSGMTRLGRCECVGVSVCIRHKKDSNVSGTYPITTTACTISYG